MVSFVIITNNMAGLGKEFSSSMEIMTAFCLPDFRQIHSFELHAFNADDHLSASSFFLVYESLRAAI